MLRKNNKKFYDAAMQKSINHSKIPSKLPAVYEMTNARAIFLNATHFKNKKRDNNNSMKRKCTTSIAQCCLKRAAFLLFLFLRSHGTTRMHPNACYQFLSNRRMLIRRKSCSKPWHRSRPTLSHAL